MLDIDPSALSLDLNASPSKARPEQLIQLLESVRDDSSGNAVLDVRVSRLYKRKDYISSASLDPNSFNGSYMNERDDVYAINILVLVPVENPDLLEGAADIVDEARADAEQSREEYNRARREALEAQAASIENELRRLG